MRFRAILAAGLFWLAQSAGAQAKWLEVTSDSFIFVGDVSEHNARRLVRELEVYRATIVNLSGTKARPEIRPVRVYGVASTRAATDFTGIAGIAGVYTKGDEGPVFVMSMTGGMADDSEARLTALHEYAHHVVMGFSSSYYPLWFNEGFAEYLSSFFVDGNKVTLGRPNSKFAGALRARSNWIDYDKVYSSITSYPFRGTSPATSRRISEFYGISWLSVHYIQSTPSVAQNLPAYIAGINQGKDPKEAFEEAFGKSYDAFGKEVRAYWRRNKFAVSQFEFNEDVLDASLKVRELSKREAAIAAMLGKAVFLSRSDDSYSKSHRRQIRREMEAHEERYGTSPELLSVAKALEMAEGDYDGAVSRGEEAVALDATHPLALQAAGDAYYHRYQDGGKKDIGDVAKAREHFRALLAIDTTNPNANHHFAKTFLFDGTPPDEQALRAAGIISILNRNPSNFSDHLDVAGIYVAAGYTEEACTRLKYVGPWILRTEADAKARAEEEGEDESEEENADTHGNRLRALLEALGTECSLE